MAPLPCTCSRKLCLLLMVFLLAMDISSASMDKDIELIWGQDHSFMYMDGDTETLALSLVQSHGSGFRSIGTYLYARMDIGMRLIKGNSAGTVATIYMISEGPWEIHDEIDLEFLGNITGQPYNLHTNVYANGVGGREQQFRLWFDPTIDFHTYSIVWNPKHVLILVDGVLIRDFKNHAADGVPFPTWQQMRLYGSLWNADDWATEGGLIKTDWSQSPFVAYYRKFNATWCVPSPGVSWCGDEPPESTLFDVDQSALSTMQWVHDKYMIYDYCTDYKRFAYTGFPKECSLH